MSPTSDPRPEPPLPPEADDGCGSGCVTCVFDYYDEQLQRYEQAVAAWRLRNADSASAEADSDISAQ